MGSGERRYLERSEFSARSVGDTPVWAKEKADCVEIPNIWNKRKRVEYVIDG
jgi:hypothetical protein